MTITDIERQKHAYAALRLLQAGCREESEKELYLTNGLTLTRFRAPDGRWLADLALATGLSVEEELAAIEQVQAIVLSLRGGAAGNAPTAPRSPAISAG